MVDSNSMTAEFSRNFVSDKILTKCFPKTWFYLSMNKFQKSNTCTALGFKELIYAISSSEPQTKRGYIKEYMLNLNLVGTTSRPSE